MPLDSRDDLTVPDPALRRPFGRTGLAVTPICVGTSPLASMPGLYGYEVGEQRARATVEAVFDGPFNFLDTSNNYGGGSAERRIGAVVRDLGGVPAGFVLATKVDADPDTGDFSGERVRRSAEESLERLGVGNVPLLYLHDPEFHITFEEAMSPGGAVEALVALREAGVADHIGIAGGPVGLLRRYVATGVFDAVISHNRWTLVNREADPLLDEAREHGVAFVNGAPYGGGMLVKGPDAQPRYAYRDTGESVRNAVRAMRRVCDAHGVPLAAAALQFSLRDPRVTSTIVGVSEPERLAETLSLAATPIPPALWDELDRHLPSPAAWLD
ncbi:aldo/keto reductase [Microbispora bryophytorum]|uniref:Aldo/keto reductase n=1 Tax=Microbispora bryophytorum subsp. camponoti TaxID=1677852 RepID=A0ABR8L0C4_9ACTN|nr:aldo/keto reductase [Microbispora camponoti]MBD3143681.1 aldo/keto reductase [Microbispora camponoti]